MSHNDTLMDGFESDDSETPPPFGPSKPKNQNDKDNNDDSLEMKVNEDYKVQDQSGLSHVKNKLSNIKTKTLRPLNSKIYDPEQEIMRLKEELILKNFEIERLRLKMKGINNMPTAMFENMYDEENEPMYHLAFLFSSPLVRRINTNLEMIMQLDYQNEIRNIEKQLKSVKHEVRYKIEVATRDNFGSVIADAPFALHFTGHGIQNDRNALGPDFIQHKDKGDILLLESETGIADYLFENDLK